MTTGHITTVRVLPETRKKRAEMSSRIEVLAQLSKRRQDAENAGNFPELARIAQEYFDLGMHRTANEIRKEL